MADLPSPAFEFGCSLASEAIRCHAGKPADVVRAFDRIKEELGHPEVLIYNAGVVIFQLVWHLHRGFPA